jgi:Arabinose efflux permease
MKDAQPATPTIRFLDRSTPPNVLTLIVLSGLSALAMNIFLPSLPQMAEHFGTTYAVMQLSVPLYLLFSAVLQLFIGPISDNLGRRRVMIWAWCCSCWPPWLHFRPQRPDFPPVSHRTGGDRNRHGPEPGGDP